MVNTNYIGSIVKILEKPRHKVIGNNISVTKFRVQLPQMRDTRMITLVFWGKLAHDVINYYQKNDYIMIEGYLSLRTKVIPSLLKQNVKKIEVTVLKVYPFLLKSDRTKKGN